MDQFANQPSDERQAIFEEVASQRDVTPVIIEKDFWVCWALKRLFTHPELAPYLTFKGGTSLSKAYGLIERFSEDIDLTISRNAPFLSEGNDPMEEGISNKERRRRIDSLKADTLRFIQEYLLPRLKETISEALGSMEDWKLTSHEDSNNPTLFFAYPATAGESSYIPSVIRLEFGARGEPEPAGGKVITPYAAEDFPDLFTDPQVTVQTLAVERSFWEKVTILHSLYHGVRQRDRMSRHYYDTVMMAQGGIAERALQNPELLEQVVRNKSLMFPSALASYDTAMPGSIKLVPEGELLDEIRADYEAMAEMFMGDFASFDEILEELQILENRLNEQ